MYSGVEFKNTCICMADVEKEGRVTKCGKSPTQVDANDGLFKCPDHHSGSVPAYVAERGRPIVPEGPAPSKPVELNMRAVGITPEGAIVVALGEDTNGNFPYDQELKTFIDAMRYKLQKNSKKGRWETYDLAKAFELLRREVNELEQAINEGNSIDITLEGADVANFAMIIVNIALTRGGQSVRT